MKRNLFALALAIVFVLPASAQVKLGIEGGLNSSQTPSSKKPETNGRISGFQLGGTVDYKFRNNLIIMSGLSFVQKGGQLSQELFINAGSVIQLRATTPFPSISTTLNYIELPLKVGHSYQLSKDLCLIPSIGAYGAYGFNAGNCSLDVFRSSTEKGETIHAKWKPFDGYTDSQDKRATLDKFNKFDIGAVIGVKAVILEHYSASLNYSHGLKDAQKQLGLRNSNLQLSVGYIF